MVVRLLSCFLSLVTTYRLMIFVAGLFFFFCYELLALYVCFGLIWLVCDFGFNCLPRMLSVCSSIRLKVLLFCAGVNASPHHHLVEVI